MDGVAHDACNLLSAVQLYCQLLASPGVLAPPFHYYADDLRRIAEAGSRLGEHLIEALRASSKTVLTRPPEAQGALDHPFPRRCNLVGEVLQMRQLLADLAGPQIRFEVECLPCAGDVGLNSEELLRILFNLVANAVEAFGLDGQTQGESGPQPVRFLRITVQRGGAASFIPRSRTPFQRPETVVLAVRDSGPGISADQLTHIFDAGFSTRRGSGDRPCHFDRLDHCDHSDRPRGLGLSIVRDLVERAGGAIRAVSSIGAGTRFEIELPILNHPREGLVPQKSSVSGSDLPRLGPQGAGSLICNRDAGATARSDRSRATTTLSFPRRDHSQFVQLLLPKK